MVEDCPRTPSLTNSEETISSGSELPSARPLLHQSPPNHAAPSFSKGKERAAPRVSMHSPRWLLNPISYYRSSVSSSSHDSMHAFIAAWSHPAILQCLLSCIGWREFHAVMRTCRHLRDVFNKPDVKNIILSSFVPGYRFEGRNPVEDEVHIDLTDLEALSELLSPIFFIIAHLYLRSAIAIFTFASLSHACRLHCLYSKWSPLFGPNFDNSTCSISPGAFPICAPSSVPRTSLADKRGSGQHSP